VQQFLVSPVKQHNKLSMYFLSRLLLLTLFIPSMCFGQANLATSSLIILIEEPNKKIEEKLNPDELKNYQQEIENYNTSLKKCVEQCWKIEAKPTFVNKIQFNKIIEDKPANTLLLMNSKYNFNYADYAAFKISNKLYNSKDIVVENYSKKQLPYRASILEIKKADMSLESSALASALMPGLKQEVADLTYAIKSMALQIDYRTKGTTEVQLMKMYIKNAPHLKELTLLISQNDLDESAKTDIKNHYKLPVQIVNKEAIENAILTADKSKAICLVMPNPDGSFAFKVFDAFNMELLGQTATIPPSEYYPELNNKIKVNHLEDFTHYCD
jgi:hypothetical protein